MPDPAAARRALIDRVLSGVEDWEARWGTVADAHLPDGVEALLDEYAVRMDASLPFYHPRYAGQMLKAPHPVAVAGYLAAMIVNPNNHALDASQATSPMEFEVVRMLANMFGLPDRAIGHLTSSGTIANLETVDDIHEASETMTLHLEPALDIVTYFPTLTSMRAVDSASDALLHAGMEDEEDPVFLSSLRVGAEAFAALHPVIERDTESARVLRSVLMKPEHEHSIAWLAERVETLADGVTHRPGDPPGAAA